MRWQAKQFDDVRTKKRFLFFPKCIQGEWRWLEIATWIEKVESGQLIGSLVWVGQYWR